MNIIDLPAEINENIFRNLNYRLIKNNIFYNIINKDKNKIKTIALMRIKLFLKIMIKYSKLKKYIIARFNNLINKCYFFHTIVDSHCINCIYYAPMIKEGSCRFCLKQEKQHKFKAKFIESFIKF